ncbi:MAG: PKD domain-containing protein [Bacteroidota bacterium]
MNHKLFCQYLFLLSICFAILISKGKAQGTDFVADSTIGCAPFTVDFEAQARGAVSYHWDFGNGDTSNQTDPSVTYILPGSYTVTLEVNYQDGLREKIVKVAYIKANGAPIPIFFANRELLCAGEEVQFTDRSRTNAGVQLRRWDFGNGAFDTTVRNPVHIYPDSGFYSVRLAITDTNGCSNVAVRNQYIKVKPKPDASFTVENGADCSGPLTVKFFSKDSLAPIHFWDFGNGNTSTQPNPTHTYVNIANYTVTHIAADTFGGCADTFTLANAVTIGTTGRAVIQFAPQKLCLGDQVQFSSPVGSAGVYSWDFGDGSPNSSDPRPNHLYVNSGTYTVKVEIQRPSGCLLKSSALVKIGGTAKAKFASNQRFACDPPMTVRFADRSSSGAVSWLWDFGDGNISTQQNPTHIYTQRGDFDVSLTVMSVDSCFSTDVSPGFIQIDSSSIDIFADVREGCAPLQVKFSPLTDNIGQIASYLWDFGDGNVSTRSRATHVYRNPGVYTVRLTVTTSDGCVRTVEKTDFIQAGVQGPVSFVADTTLGCANYQFQFTNSTSINGDCFWQFGDGQTDTLCNPLHTYIDTGFHDVTLTVTDRGCVNTLTKPAYIYIHPAIARFSVDEIIGCRLPFTVNATDRSVGPDTWTWDFGDGSPLVNAQNPSHTYTQEGRFVITLNITNSLYGCSHQMQQPIEVLTVDADFTEDSIAGCKPLFVNFQETSYQGVFWEWNFGDSTTATGNTASHTYGNIGYYDVQLIATNRLGCKDTLVKDSLVHVRGPLADFMAVPDKGCAPQQVAFTDQSSITSSIVTYSWDFGDGGTDSVANPLHTYLQAGRYDVLLAVTDSEGCSDTLMRTEAIDITLPVANFRVKDTLTCANNPISFTDQSTGVGLSYLWDFGDGNTSALPNPNHTYAQDGRYTISLTVTDRNGCDSTLVKPAHIRITEPYVSFTADSTFGVCPPLVVSFQPDSVGPHPVASWKWDFGDGSQSRLQTPIHTYVLPDTYTVSLVMVTQTGCTDTALVEDYITLLGPVGTYSLANSSGCPTLDVELQSYSHNSILFEWDTDDGTILIGDTVQHTYIQSGVYYPQITLEDTNGCRVQFPARDSVVVHHMPVAGFTADSLLVCARTNMTFRDTSQSVDPLAQWIWDFGDGGISTQQNPTYSYQVAGNYDLKLKVATVFGCEDSIEVSTFVRVRNAPIAKMRISDSVGCTPVNILFEDISPSGGLGNTGRTWDWDFNGLTSSLQTDTFTYAVPDTYTVILTLAGTNGCPGRDTSTIVVHPLPEPDFVAADSSGCAPKSVVFANRTPSGMNWGWDFGDGTQDTSRFPIHAYTRDGIYSVSLTVQDSNGCINRFTRTDYIRLLRPVADFVASDTTACPGTPIRFTDQTASDDSLVTWSWNFGNGNTDSVRHPVALFDIIGDYDVQLIVTDVYGCKDTAFKPAYIVIPPLDESKVPEISLASVVSDQSIEVKFTPYPNLDGDFSRYVLYRSLNGSRFEAIDTSMDATTFLFLDEGIDARRDTFCYKLQFVNLCERSSKLARAQVHCPVQLTATPVEPGVSLDVDLNWTPYLGFDTIDRYEVYRVNDYAIGSGELIASLPPDVHTYRDTDMECENSISYRVITRTGSVDLVSGSDTSYAYTINPLPEMPLHMVRATVENNLEVLVEWEIPNDPGLREFAVEKDNGDGFREVLRESVLSPNRKYQDIQVEVDRQSYIYRVMGIDSCGVFTPLGNPGNSIHLTARYLDNQIVLNWTPYEGWEEGVDKYIVQLYRESSNSFVDLAELAGERNIFVDNISETGQESNCYRILAVEKGGNETSSLSNEACVGIKALIFAPTAFTPNGDGANEEFLVQVTNVSSYQIQIFNRWGRLVFSADQPDQPWNGTMNGKAVPEGNYVYVIQATTNGGTAFYRQGNITLIR